MLRGIWGIWYCVGGYSKAPAKRSQHLNATYRNIGGRNILRVFGHPVATCCHMLGVVGSNLKMVKFFTQNLTLNDWSRGDSEFCLPKISLFPQDDVERNIDIQG